MEMPLLCFFHNEVRDSVLHTASTKIRDVLGDFAAGVSFQGFKDVGTWHVASVGKSASTAPAPNQMTTPGGYGY